MTPQDIPGAKKALRTAALSVLAREGLCCLQRRTTYRDRALVLMYHEVLPDEQAIEAWTAVKQSAFALQMAYLRHAFTVVDLEEILDGPASLSDTGKPPAVVTFDDGYAGNLHYALPVIEALRIPITIFVATQNVLEQRMFWFDEIILALQGLARPAVSGRALLEELAGPLPLHGLRGEALWNRIEAILQSLKRLEPEMRAEKIKIILRALGYEQDRMACLRPMTPEEVAKLASSPLVTIGAHSHGHDILTQLSTKALNDSIRISKSLLEGWSGRQVRYFAYPNGDYNKQVKQAVMDAGFTGSLTTEPRLWHRGDDPFSVPRIGIGRYDTMPLFKVRVSGCRLI